MFRLKTPEGCATSQIAFARRDQVVCKNTGGGAAEVPRGLVQALAEGRAIDVEPVEDEGGEHISLYRGDECVAELPKSLWVSLDVIATEWRRRKAAQRDKAVPPVSVAPSSTSPTKD